MKTKPFGVALWIWGFGLLVSALALVAFTQSNFRGDTVENHRKLLHLISKAELIQSFIPGDIGMLRTYKRAVKSNQLLNELEKSMGLPDSSGSIEANMIDLNEATRKLERDWRDYRRLLDEIKVFQGNEMVKKEISDFISSDKLMKDDLRLDDEIQTAIDGNQVKDLAALKAGSEATKNEFYRLKDERFKRHLDWYEAHRKKK